MRAVSCSGNRPEAPPYSLTHCTIVHRAMRAVLHSPGFGALYILLYLISSHSRPCSHHQSHSKPTSPSQSSLHRLVSVSFPHSTSPCHPFCLARARAHITHTHTHTHSLSLSLSLSLLPPLPTCTLAFPLRIATRLGTLPPNSALQYKCPFYPSRKRNWTDLLHAIDPKTSELRGSLAKPIST